jgi:hypothetical protein
VGKGWRAGKLEEDVRKMVYTLDVTFLPVIYFK